MERRNLQLKAALHDANKDVSEREPCTKKARLELRSARQEEEVDGDEDDMDTSFNECGQTLGKKNLPPVLVRATNNGGNESMISTSCSEISSIEARQMRRDEEEERSNVLEFLNQRTYRKQSHKDIVNGIKEFVFQEIFPKKKFFTKKKDTLYSENNVLARIVLDEMTGITREDINERQAWWDQYFKVVRSALGSKRSTCGFAIKKDLYGTNHLESYLFLNLY